jgi:hypothetical protein
MRIPLVKACEYSAPLANGRQCMMGIFDNIVVQFMPVDHPPFCICIQVEFDQADVEAEHEVLCRLINPDAKVLFDFPLSVSSPRDPSGGNTRIFISINIPGLRLDNLGDHRIEVLVDGQKSGEENIPVLLMQAPP